QEFETKTEATCPVCLEYFTEPVTVECGHNFYISCPQCRETVQQRNLRPNRQLANMVEITKQLSLQAAKGTGGDRVCEEHQEALKLFCEEDQTSICLICRESQAHRAHTVVPIQEAAQEYKMVPTCTRGDHGAKHCVDSRHLEATHKRAPDSSAPCQVPLGFQWIVAKLTPGWS
uniref:RING-type E3 ubiquitin transferase n=1 Tax=Gopherus evgoodei TaxID=1825980 RepID=A0A8C4Y6Y2_9SAUR